MRILVLLVLIMAVFVFASTMQIDVDNYVFIEARGLAQMPFYWNGSAFVPAPVVYFVKYENASWVEVWEKGRPAELSVPFAEGPYIAVPREALNKFRPPRGVPVDTPRGRAWLYLSDRPSSEGLPPYGIVLYLNATADPPGCYRGKPLVTTTLPASLKFSPAPPASSYASYLFAFQTYPLYAGPWRPPVPVKNATGLSSSGYSLGQTYSIYLGYRVARVYLAVASSGSYSASLDLYCGSTPSPTAYCGSLSSSSYTTDLGAVFVFDTAAYSNSYIWAQARLYSYTPQTVRAFLSASYLRPAPGDPNWGALVFEWKSVFADSYSTYLPSGTRRVMFTAQIPQGSSTPLLAIKSLQVVNCAPADAETVRIYIGGQMVYQATASSSGSNCRLFVFPNISVQAPSALDYVKFNTSYVPLVLEFDPPLYASPDGTAQPSISLTGASLQGYRWPQIWRENAYNFRRDLVVLAGLRQPPVFSANYYSFNLWNRQQTKANESSAGLLGKFLVETAVSIGQLATSDTPMRIRVNVQFVGFSKGSAAPIWKFVCVAKDVPSEQGLYVSGPGSAADWGLWSSIVHGAYWWANSIYTFLSLIKQMPSWVGIVMWGAGEVISKLFPASSGCSLGSYVGLEYDAGYATEIISAHYNFTVNAIPSSTLSYKSGGLGVNVYAYRYSPDWSDYGSYVIYGSYKAPYIDVSYAPNWFDGPFEPYRLDGGILVRVYPT
ncbi:MAG: hypothetical protein ABWJ97_03325 [Thermoproteus sp.]